MVTGRRIMADNSSTPFGSAPACISIAVWAGLALTGCTASADRYPSLAPRAIETARAPVQAAPMPSPLSNADLARLSNLTGRAQGSHERFLAAQPGALELARAAANAGSESDLRARALVAAAQLSSLRAQTRVSLGELDDLEAEAAASFAEIGEIRAAQATVSRLIASQNEAIAVVESRLGL